MKVLRPSEVLPDQLGADYDAIACHQTTGGLGGKEQPADSKQHQGENAPREQRERNEADNRQAYMLAELYHGRVC